MQPNVQATTCYGVAELVQPLDCGSEAFRRLQLVATCSPTAEVADSIKRTVPQAGH